MDTKSLIITIATNLFQQKGYLGVGINEILKACSITKGSLYHHFPNGKEELLITCLQSMNGKIISDIEDIFHHYPSTQSALEAMIEKLVDAFNHDGTITSYTFSSIVSEIASLNEPVLQVVSSFYAKIQAIYFNKLVADGYSKETANSIALMMTASIEGGIMLCLTKKTSEPLQTISHVLPNLLKEF